MPVDSVALAIPAYNEADGIEGFLRELDEEISKHPTIEHIYYVIIDDTSSDDTVEVCRKLQGQLNGRVIVEPNEVNLGHGPTVIRAYNHAISTGANWILQVDGDGQFEGVDVHRLFAEAEAGNDIVTGIRETRFDPWYRTVVTKSLPVVLKLGFGVDRTDVNCPLRLYRTVVLEKILLAVPNNAVTPHVLMTVLEEKSGKPTKEIIVQHRPRRGDTETGTTWQKDKSIIIPSRLRKLLVTAVKQLAHFRSTY